MSDKDDALERIKRENEQGDREAKRKSLLQGWKRVANGALISTSSFLLPPSTAPATSEPGIQADTSSTMNLRTTAQAFGAGVILSGAVNVVGAGGTRDHAERIREALEKEKSSKER